MEWRRAWSRLTSLRSTWSRQWLPRQMPWMTIGAVIGGAIFSPLHWAAQARADPAQMLFETVFFAMLGGTSGLLLEWGRLPPDPRNP